MLNVGTAIIYGDMISGTGRMGTTNKYCFGQAIVPERAN